MKHYHSSLVRIMDRARKVLDVDKATLFMHDPDTKELWSAVIEDEDVREIRIPYDEGLAGNAFQTGEIINVKDAIKDERFRKDIDKQSGYVTKSIISAPVVNSKGEIIGVLQAINKNTGGPFSNEDEEKIRKFTQEVAFTIENSGQWKIIIPGLLVVTAVAVTAALLHSILPEPLAKTMGAVLIAIVLGLVIGNTFNLPVNWEPGIRFALHNMLRLAIILLGARIVFTDVINIGSTAVIMILISIATAFGVAHLLGRIVKLPVRLATLLAMGAAICGNSAIAALAPVIKAREEEFSLAVAVTTLFGTTAVVLYPFIGSYFGFSDVFFGTWVGLAVPDTAQVVATGFALGSESGEVATIVKLTRNAFLGIMIVLVGLVYARWVGGQIGGKKVPLSKRLKQSLPLFLVGFLVMALLNTLGLFDYLSELVGYNVQSGLNKTSGWLMLGSLAGVGLGTNLGRIRSAGLKPVYVGVGVTLSVALVSILTIKLLGPV